MAVLPHQGRHGLNFSASAEHVKTHTASYEDKNMVYKFSGMFYHRWNKKIWMRLNYWCNTSYPQLDQVTEYGYFTDSLTWSGGNQHCAHKCTIRDGCGWTSLTFSIYRRVITIHPTSFLTSSDVGKVHCRQVETVFTLHTHRRIRCIRSFGQRFTLIKNQGF